MCKETDILQARGSMELKKPWDPSFEGQKIVLSYTGTSCFIMFFFMTQQYLNRGGMTQINSAYSFQIYCDEVLCEPFLS